MTDYFRELNTQQIKSILDSTLSSRNASRSGHPRFLRPDWQFEKLQSQIDLPDFNRLKDESDDSWSTRSELEQKKFIEAFVAMHRRHDGESKNETLERLDQGHQTLKVVLARLAVPINSETHPLEWKSYEAFERTCYERYAYLVMEVLESQAFQNAPLKPYEPADHKAVLALGRLKSTAVHGEYYARNICERLAKAWANGKHRPTFRKLKPNEEYPLWEKRQNANSAVGITIEGALNDFEGCFYVLKDLPGKLTSSSPSFNAAEARQFSKNYASASHEFRSFAKGIESGLKKENVRPYLGGPYKELFEGLLEVVEILNKTLIDVVCPKLDSSAATSIQSETATTIRILKEGLVAAKG